MALIEPWAAATASGGGLGGGLIGTDWERGSGTCASLSGGGWVPLVVAGMSGGLVNLYDVRASPGYDGGRAALAASLRRQGGWGIERVDGSRLHVRVSNNDWRLEALWGKRRGSLGDVRGERRVGLGERALETTSTLVSLVCSGQHHLAVLSSAGELSCFDLRKLSVCTHVTAGEPPPPMVHAAMTGGDGAGTQPPATVGPKGARYTEEFDWRAGRMLADSQMFCDVLSRGGAVSMACDNVKVVTCRADDARTAAVDFKTGQVLSITFSCTAYRMCSLTRDLVDRSSTFYGPAPRHHSRHGTISPRA